MVFFSSVDAEDAICEALIRVSLLTVDMCPGETFSECVWNHGVLLSFVIAAWFVWKARAIFCWLTLDFILHRFFKVTVTIYLLGCRAKQTLAFTGPQLDLSAFTQLYQHYLHNLYGNQNTLCNQVDKPFEETVVATGTAYFAHEKQTVTDTGDELNSGSVTPRSESTEMPGQVSCEINDVDDPLSLGPKSSLGSDSYREGKRGYYADSIGSSCDSACSSSSPSMVDNSGRPQIMNGTYKDEVTASFFNVMLCCSVNLVVVECARALLLR